MIDKKYMEMAIKEARKSKESIGCGVVIEMNGKVIAISYNKQKTTNNASAHAEINAISKAGKKLGNKILRECSIYCTCEPCTMCLSAIIFAQIPRLIYGTSMKETFPTNLPITLNTKELLKYTNHKLEVISGFMKKECTSLL